MDTKIITHIIKCDPRYQTTTKDGLHVLIDETEDGRREERKVTTEEYALTNEISDTEVFFATIDTTIADIAKTNITPTAEMVDTLLDLRSLFARISDDAQKGTTAFFQMWRSAMERVTAYEDCYGPLSTDSE